MRPLLISGFAIYLLASSSVAFAEEPAVSASTTSTSTTTTAPNSPTSTTVSSTTATVPAVSGTTTTTQATVDATGSQPVAIPPSPSESGGETTTKWLNRPLLATGLVLFGGTYGASAIVGAESNNGHDNPNLYYPIVGPWLDMAQRGAGTGDKVLLAFDGVGQGLGAVAIVTSLFVPESKHRSWFLVGSDKLRVAPTNVGTGYGMGAAGRF